VFTTGDNVRLFIYSRGSGPNRASAVLHRQGSSSSGSGGRGGGGGMMRWKEEALGTIREFEVPGVSRRGDTYTGEGGNVIFVR